MAQSQDARLHHAGDAGVLGLGEGLGHAVLPLVETRLLEPRHRPSAVGVEVALLLGQRLVEGLVDERQRLAHRERLARGVEHLGIAGVDRHARADGRLRQVHRRMLPRWRCTSATGSSALSGPRTRAVVVGGSVVRLRQTRMMLEARAFVSQCHGIAFRPFGSHRPGAADGEASADHRIEEGLPAGAGGAVSSRSPLA